MVKMSKTYDKHHENNKQTPTNIQLHSPTYMLSYGGTYNLSHEMIGCAVIGHASTGAIADNNDASSASLPKTRQKI